MSKGEMKAFHAAFVAADKSLDERVCKDGSNGADNCKAGAGDDTKDKENSANNLGYAYKDGGPAKVGDTDAPKIAESITKLSKEEKATLAAAFAKAVEGVLYGEEQRRRV